ncbi:MAG: carbonic anhydrase [Lachnospiraceae bacterium]|nr:carbonic anhydrase [Lachnospiraceae bacterium]
MSKENLSPQEALEKLKEGNKRYLTAETNSGDVSPKIRKRTCDEGQSPFAIVVACSDSRVIPESIFMAGIGELFVIRVAGNVMDNHQLGSIEYAAGHLGCKLVVILGHSNCGAVDAAIHHSPSGYVKYITDEIKKAIGEEKDPIRASCLNVERSVAAVRDSLGMKEAGENSDVKVCGAVYHIDSGKVEFLDEK